jgi:hypothetical protein
MSHGKNNVCRRAAQWLCAALLTFLFAAPARALEFQCIEPSRYKNLLPVFEDDPNVFFSYFGLPRGRLPDMETCRALLVTGMLGAGDAATLLDRTVEGKGWLAVLYLGFQGTNIEEEAKIASIIRGFSMKTRAVRHDVFNYFPDFVLRWPPPLPLTGTSAAAPPARDELFPLHRGLRTFFTRRDLPLKLDRDRSNCDDGCRVAYHAGVNRLFNTLPPGTPAPAPLAVTANDKLRVALTYQIDWNRLPTASDPPAGKPLGWASVSPPATARLLRDKCNPEFSVAEALEARLGEALETATRNNLKPREVEALAAPFEAFGRGGVRLQQCLAAALEADRLASFQRHCPQTCDRLALGEKFAATARELLERAGRL